MEFELIKKNPTEFAKVPKKIDSIQDLENNKEAIKYLEKHELAAFLHMAKTKGLTYDELFFSLLAYSGMRIGEMLALKWKDINFNESTINITKTLYNPKNREKEFQLLTPKTRGSVREIKMDEDIMSLLRKHKKEQTEWKMMTRDEFTDLNFVITRASGYPETIKKIATRMQRLLHLAGIERNLTPHSFRHTHTSLLIEAGVGIKEIQQRLGHTDVDTTMNIYAHMTKEMEEKASHKFSELMRSLK
ncbi:site-specific integrase [Salimicrobium jeotgali]|uniref:Integrase n=1 Tax=Salimicrobium jeotgali TaxID=1230341 RepID=K2H699_9BACI|nr:site-specific integrase [Salimicrobium jeotgali]APC65606.1 site-specific integrase [Salimicrobium jeotgali]EKE31320.1 integrase [Salimicrobium jeotgali]MBM7696929.1 integrase [Salimicrobium jeotgali]